MDGWFGLTPSARRVIFPYTTLKSHLTQLLQKKPENKGAGECPHPCFRVTSSRSMFETSQGA
jgi:hypothetical protein